LEKRLAIIDEAQRNITDLSQQMVGLQDILSNKQARGAFGEIQLRDLDIAALPPSAYEVQVTLGNSRRADCLLKLPNPPGAIVIDFKFPLSSNTSVTSRSVTSSSAKRLNRRYCSYHPRPSTRNCRPIFETRSKILSASGCGSYRQLR